MKILMFLLRYVLLLGVIFVLLNSLHSLKLQVQDLEKENYALKWIVRECRGN